MYTTIYIGDSYNYMVFCIIPQIMSKCMISGIAIIVKAGTLVAKVPIGMANGSGWH